MKATIHRQRILSICLTILFLVLGIIAVYLPPSALTGLHEVADENLILTSSYAPTGDRKRLTFELPPGTQGFRILSQQLIPRASEQEFVRSSEESVGLPYGIRYQISQGSKVVDRGEWHFLAKAARFYVPGRQELQFKHALSDPRQRQQHFVSEAQDVYLPLAQPATQTLHLTIDLDKLEGFPTRPLVRVLSRFETPLHQRALMWVRIPPVIRQMLAATSLGAANDLPKTEQANLMRWQERPRAPVGTEQKDFAAFMIKTWLLSEQPRLSEQGTSSERKIGPHMARVYLLRGSENHKLRICTLSGPAENSLEPTTPPLVRIRHWDSDRMQMRILYEGPVVDPQGAPPVIDAPPGPIELSSGHSVQGSLVLADDDPHNCRPKESDLFIENSAKTPVQMVGEGDSLAIPVVHPSAHKPTSVIRVQLFLRERPPSQRQIVKENLNYRVVDSNGAVLEQGQMTIESPLSRYVRVEHQGFTHALSTPVSRYFYLPNKAHELILTPEHGALIAVSVRDEAQAPQISIPDQQLPSKSPGVARMLWLPLNLNQNTDEERWATSYHAPWEDLESDMNEWVAFETTDNGGGHFVLSPTAPETSKTEFGYTYSFVGNESSSARATLQKLSALSPWRVLYKNPGGQRNVFRVFVNGECHGEAVAEDRYGEIDLPPLSERQLAAGGLVEFAVDSQAPISLWGRGLSPYPATTSVFHKRFMYAMEPGQKRSFLVEKFSSDAPQFVNMLYVPAEGTANSTTPLHLQVELKITRPHQFSPYLGWTPSKRTFALYPSQSQQQSVILNSDLVSSYSTWPFGFDLDQDLAAGKYELELTNLSGVKGYVTLHSRGPRHIKGPALQVRSQTTELQPLAATCGRKEASIQ